MRYLFPFGPLLLKLYDGLAPEQFKTEGILFFLSILNLVLHLALYGAILVSVYNIVS